MAKTKKAKTKKERSYAILTVIAFIGFVVLIGTLAFEIQKPIIFNQYKFLNVLLKISAVITVLTLIIELILTILDGAQNKRKKKKQILSAPLQDTNVNDSYSNQSNISNYANSPTTMNANNNFNELNSPIHPNVILQTKYEGKTFIVRIKQKMKVVNK